MDLSFVATLVRSPTPCSFRANLRVFFVDSPLAPFLNRRVVHTDPTSSSLLAQMERWIADCTKNHPDCVASAGPLPTRVLDVQNSRIRLVETSGRIEHCIALSHCWGNSPIFTHHKLNALVAIVGLRNRTYPENLPGCCSYYPSPESSIFMD